MLRLRAGGTRCARRRDGGDDQVREAPPTPGKNIRYDSGRGESEPSRLAPKQQAHQVREDVYTYVFATGTLGQSPNSRVASIRTTSPLALAARESSRSHSGLPNMLVA